MGTIVIAGLRELGVHGVLPEEQTRPQPFEVDVELRVDLTPAGQSDSLDNTVDYAAVAEAVSRVVTSERYQLLERLATRIAEVCRVDERVTSVAVTGSPLASGAKRDRTRLLVVCPSGQVAGAFQFLPALEGFPSLLRIGGGRHREGEPRGRRLEREVGRAAVAVVPLLEERRTARCDGPGERTGSVQGRGGSSRRRRSPPGLRSPSGPAESGSCGERRSGSQIVLATAPPTIRPPTGGGRSKQLPSSSPTPRRCGPETR